MTEFLSKPTYPNRGTTTPEPLRFAARRGPTSLADTLCALTVCALLLPASLAAADGPLDSRSAVLPVDSIIADAKTGAGRTDEPRRFVRLIIDYGDGVEKHFGRICWRKEITVLDALGQAAKHPRGIIFRVRGSGDRAFLTEIDGLKNEGARGRNWVYRVNGKPGDRSIGIFTLEAGDTVLWKFDRYR